MKKDDVKNVKKEGKKFVNDFKSFITRGNVVDMAVGVVIGAAFSKIVTGLVNYILNPFLGIFIKSGDLDSIKTVITPAVVENGETVTPEVAILWGTWLQTIIDFLIVAFFIFLFVRIINRIRNVVEADKIEADKKKKEEDDKKKKKAEERIKQIEDSHLESKELLTEIRDLLKENNK